jgi:hypothetical protein
LPSWLPSSLLSTRGLVPYENAVGSRYSMDVQLAGSWSAGMPSSAAAA